MEQLCRESLHLMRLLQFGFGVSRCVHFDRSGNSSEKADRSGSRAICSNLGNVNNALACRERPVSFSSASDTSSEGLCQPLFQQWLRAGYAQTMPVLKARLTVES